MNRPSILFCLALMMFAALGARADPVRIVVISDLNGSYGSTEYSSNVHRAVSSIIAIAPDLVLSTGDMVAGQRRPALSDAEIRSMWKAFHAAVTSPLAEAGIPLAVTPGNHDGSAYAGFEAERLIFAEEWRKHRPDLRFVGAPTYPFFYAFDIGPARIVSIDATIVGRLDDAQMTALESIFNEAGPARIVFSHLPLWPFTEGRENEIIGDPALERLLEEIGVDLYLSGHHHAFYPGQLDQFSVVAQSELGGGSRRLIGSDQRGPKSITILNIAEDGGIEILALQGPYFDKRIDIQRLPERLNTSERVIHRIDTVPSGAVELAD